MGGLARRATLLEQKKDSCGFYLIVDAGGFMKGYAANAALQSEFLIKGLSMLGYDAVNLAVKDFSLGGKYLQTMRERYDVPFVAANVQYLETGKPFTNQYLVKKLSASAKNGQPAFDKITVGIFGLCDRREALFHENLNEPKVISTDPIPAAKKAVAELSKCDLVVLLYNGRYQVLEDLLAQVPNIDVVVVGGEYYRVTQSTNRIPVLVTTPSLGKYFGELKLTLNEHKKIINYQNSRIPLDSTVADDPRLSRLVSDFEKADRMNQPDNAE